MLHFPSLRAKYVGVPPLLAALLAGAGPKPDRFPGLATAVTPAFLAAPAPGSLTSVCGMNSPSSCGCVELNLPAPTQYSRVVCGAPRGLSSGDGEAWEGERSEEMLHDRRVR